MITSDNGIAFIKEAEGFSSVLYKDEGHPCIGYGCDLSDEEAAQYDGKRITADEGDVLLRARVKPVEDAINRLVNPPMGPPTQNQFDALVDFTYNVGIHAFQRSTLLKELNAGSGDVVAEQFLRWTYAGGEISPALEARRKRERDLFLS